MKKKKRKIRINRLIMLFLFAFLFCFCFILFIKSDFFCLKNVEVVNNEVLSKTEIKDLSKIVKGKNLFSYDLKKVKANINESRYIENVKVKLGIPHSIIIDVKEKSISCALKDEGDNYYYIDDDMKYIDKVKYEKIKNNCPIVEADFTIKDNEVYFENKKDKDKLILLLKNIKREGLSNKIASIIFLDDNTISMKTKEGIKVIIDKNGNMKHDMAKLTQILIDLKSQNINYGKIDMTFSKYTLYTYK
ncbi:cell division protein FtsQ/DivIB [Intestinibacter sp.]|uniref:cell division protein FtsQ/DivIB n=1 Tax=Intestinibacter sp. TaxID=1965304 RepID=UPI002A90D23F|nr:FtsQ-type POTRA domain-containing protein [Intestinibacter sp.]MDY5213102.1 FtsQ-type POTRA domain-containing protein [Intestinibacter sp.]